MKRCFYLAAIFTFSLLSLSFAQQPEHLTITTYYPSPVGSYRELRAQHMAIGPTYYDGAQFGWSGQNPPPNRQIDANADLVVEGSLYVGTPSAGLPGNGSPNLLVSAAAGSRDPILRLQNLGFGGTTADFFIVGGVNNVPLFTLASLNTNMEFTNFNIGSRIRLNMSNPTIPPPAVEIGPDGPMSGFFPLTLLVRGEGNSATTGSMSIVNSQDNPMLFVRDDGNIGIGTQAPSRRLSIVDPGVGLDEPASDTLGFYTGNTERMRMDSTGYVGIGTNSPVSSQLEINGYININPVSGQSILLFQTGRTPKAQIYISGDDSLRFQTSGKDGIVIDNTRNVEIGAHAPSGLAKLEVNGKIKVDTGSKTNRVVCWMPDQTLGYCSDAPSPEGCSCTQK